jgi:GDPmannose 4,6-dehydratase
VKFTRVGADVPEKQTILVVGHEGQDGVYLRQSLAQQNDLEVIGVGRQTIEFFDSIGNLVASQPRSGDLTELIQECLPAEIYYLAAKHTSSEGNLAGTLSIGSFQEYFNQNALGYMKILDDVRLYSRHTRVFYAGSSHVFGPGPVRSLTEKTPWRPQSFYAMAKAQAMWFSQKLRREEGLHISSGILFNHESPLRGPGFFTSRLIDGAIQVQKGVVSQVVVGDLTARADWGHARDFVEAFQAMVRRDEPCDFVVATGETHSVREFVEIVFSALDLDWTEFVTTDSASFVRRKNIERANPTRIFEETKWRPSQPFEKFVRGLVSEHLSNSNRSEGLS